MSKFAAIGASVALTFVLSLGLTAAPGHAAGETADTVVASVNGTDITLGQVIALREQLPEQYQTLADDVLYNGIVDQLVQQLTISQTLDGKLTRRDELVLENQRLAYLAGSILQGVVGTAVTEEAIKAAYDARIAAMTPATEYNAAHILVADEALATDLKSQIDGGADFAELAKTNSTDRLGRQWRRSGLVRRRHDGQAVRGCRGRDETRRCLGSGADPIRLAPDQAERNPPRARPDAGRDCAPRSRRNSRARPWPTSIAKLTEGAKVTRDATGLTPPCFANQTLLDK